MILKTMNSFFKFSREQRTGILLLFAIIIIFQLLYYFVDFNSFSKATPQKEKWLSLQSQIDSLKQEKLNYVPKIYPFNPNFITDYKGYKLGMSVAEIDRLFAFRKQNKYVNSPKEFQTVTKVSDSLLNAISPYFKFPDWVNNKKEFKEYKKYDNTAFAKKEKIVVIDINQATQEDLIKIYGIGEAISIRILKFKENLGGFVSMEQMNDVWGLSPEVIENLNSHFKISASPTVKKIDINNASIKELSLFPYFKYPISKNIVTFRSMNGDIKNSEDLTKIKGLSIEKAKIIALYLNF
ncbi:helix-hairpin-helix domain-containing protein [Flavobacterium franklandianum]|uniref:Helix-hairpin-helix domain-containing protein n=1 Tax=Flavobacterium franklandianum TaxID=2594430 RepID=A0A553CJD5_9FLAO|nr:helix-hairpin-helix domain-containing protein [Flavobacterium franklandianum]TRX20605.1 helix-hairpin-helix domain-containing protein [Flavobacterium franklandianum]TRX29399.1 helix-hairpin-helix domain-containing protein [Flavobacterium franklandianum]